MRAERERSPPRLRAATRRATWEWKFGQKWSEVADEKVAICALFGVVHVNHARGMISFRGIIIIPPLLLPLLAAAAAAAATSSAWNASGRGQRRRRRPWSWGGRARAAAAGRPDAVIDDAAAAGPAAQVQYGTDCRPATTTKRPSSRLINCRPPTVGVRRGCG